MTDQFPMCPCFEENAENYTMISLAQYYVNIGHPDEELSKLFTYLTCLEFKQMVIYVCNPLRCVHLAHFLRSQGFAATFVHELMQQEHQMEELLAFNESEGDPNILVTSCCGHAMQFKNADVIIMFDEVKSVGLYCHRITSRQARKGLVINFIRKKVYLSVLREVEKLHNLIIHPLPAELSTASYIADNEEQELVFP